MKRVTLNGIKRRGLANWKDRSRWIGKFVRIWSGEHCAWWRPEAGGYTDSELTAGTWNFEEAYDRTKHCGPEKKISYYRV